MARAKKPSGPAPGKWQYTIAEGGLKITAFERADKRGHPVYRRTYDPAKQRYTDKTRLCDSIRKADGSVDPQKELAAQQALLDVHARLVKGLSEDDAPRSKAERLTLVDGLAKVLHPTEGKYASKTGYVATMESYRDRIVDILSPNAATLLYVDELEPEHYQKLWRTLARESAASGSPGEGFRACEMLVGFLQASVTWLQEQLRIPPRVGEPAKKWRRTMRGEWARITGRPIPKPSKPRYRPQEVEALFAAAPQGDPRIEFAIEMAAELRAGQLLERSRRSDIRPLNGEPLGTLTVHGSEKKRGVEMVLSPSQREYLRRTLDSGYLSVLEAAYQRHLRGEPGGIEDYYLIPAGRLVRVGFDANKRPIRKAQLKNAGSTLGRRRLNTLWHEFEVHAGVEVVKGRAWYGLRRVMSDIAEDRITDKRVLNKLGGWTRTETREGYQEEGRLDVEVATAEARDIVRPGRSPEAGQQPIDLEAVFARVAAGKKVSPEELHVLTVAMIRAGVNLPPRDGLAPAQGEEEQ